MTSENTEFIDDSPESSFGMYVVWSDDDMFTESTSVGEKC